ncbi:large subunit ribosomal protein L39e [Pancytospora philotis]|nr:large subunit ribosomal protein L39e [Pancytospora philotis]
MGSRKSTLVKSRLSKAFRSNVPIPAWKRSLPGMRDAYNHKRRNWRSNTLKIY